MPATGFTREPYPIAFFGRREDYDALRALNGSDFTDFYDEWRKLQTKEMIERERVGYDVKEIRVDPHKFGQYCASRGIAANKKALLDFITENLWE